MWTAVRRAGRAAEIARLRVSVALALAGALTLAGCQTEREAGMAAAQPRGATVAFESIDGLPQDRFQTLVQDLNGEAQLRRLAVLSREQATAYRVRGYFAAAVERGRTTISWVWDVFDRDERRAVRISGSEDAKSGKAWDAADDAMLQRIARASMEQLAGFLTRPDVVPADEQRLAMVHDASTPEAAGIFRISQPQVDPRADDAAPQSAAAHGPLPPKRPDERAAAASPATRLATR
jgi:hypothetical protein